jgi:S-(hydroxymethyl)glutathione dehydrogenase/alcohol dehydrogenase
MIESRAAIALASGSPLAIETVYFEEPVEHEVLVRISAAAICHSDLHTINGPMAHLPMIIGHEAAGVVERIGPGVSSLTVGDAVIFSFIPSCGRCHYCRRGMTVVCERGPSPAGLPLSGRYGASLPDGTPVAQMQRLGAFSERTVVHEDSCMAIPAGVDPKAASLLACGFTTGAAAVTSAAATQEGDSVVVIGAGGVGHAALMGAVIAGASTIIAVDVDERKLESAVRFGATATINATKVDWVPRVIELTEGHGADRAISCVTSTAPEALAELVAATSRGGTAVMVGSVSALSSIDLPPRVLMWEAKTLTGALFGSQNPQLEQSRFLDLYRAGRLPLGDLITATYTLDQVNDAMDDMAAGRNIRGVIEF